MQAYLINLDRRPDRLRAMSEQLDAMGVPLRRISAIDALVVADADIDDRFRDGPLGTLAKGDKCCTLSHVRAWETFLASGDAHGLILEDDVELDRAAAAFLTSDTWIPERAGLVKLERFIKKGSHILISDKIGIGDGRSIGQLKSKHTGAAAYIVSRALAKKLIEHSKLLPLPVDHLLFNPCNSDLVAELNPYQMLPPIAWQCRVIGGKTDIDGTRLAMRELGWHSIARKLRHAYYEVRLVPSQFLSLLLGKARVQRLDA